MTTRQFSRLFKEAANAAGLRKTISLHSLRHSSGSRIIPATDVRCGYFLGDRTIWGVLMAA
jgi:site-specific recombinase XerD